MSTPGAGRGPHPTTRPRPAGPDGGGGPAPRVRIVVADDHDLFRSGLVRTFVRHPRMELVGECNDGTQALERIRETRPRVAVVDLRMPVLDGLQIAEAVARDETLMGVRVVLLSARCDDALTAAALRAGAAGCLDKATSRSSLCDAVLEIADRGGSLGPDGGRGPHAGPEAP